MAKLQPVRGTHDLIGHEARAHIALTEAARAVADRYGYSPIATPIFEFTDVFQRTLGDTSDIVKKEMYTFEDKGGDSLTLRPEGTAGVARAFISGGLRNELPLKCFYAGPMFRYERPQKGRLRQFHQIGAELIGVPEPTGDVEIIALGADILDALGILTETTLELNTLGDLPSRLAYRGALVDYFTGHADALSEESRERLTRNPLRILDSKDPGDRAVINDAPVFDDYLSGDARAFFKSVRAGLDTLGIAYELNPRLVRGLDYYSHTAFEFTTEALGAQGTVLAGGRYDGLIETMGGPATPGVGWAAGIERLAMMLRDPDVAVRPVVLVGMGDDGEREAMHLARELRCAGLTIDLQYKGGLKRGLRRANRINAAAAVLIGADELLRGAVTVRDLDSGEQVDVVITDLTDHLAAYR
ncbi:MAG: histidine--tRNA ligase [Alphaproteobacteria bacterium]|nr:histidine--tRNA ligase [Alphaproteobacteria bacterium]HCP01884.1 histidine--tRNA ligase [Rhodospirillaceae bacterium]